MEYADCDSKGCFLYGHDIPLYIWQDRPAEKAQDERIAALQEQLTITQKTLGLTVLAAEAERARAERARAYIKTVTEAWEVSEDKTVTVLVLTTLIEKGRAVYASTAPAQADPTTRGGDHNTSV